MRSIHPWKRAMAECLLKEHLQLNGDKYPTTDLLLKGIHLPSRHHAVTLRARASSGGAAPSRFAPLAGQGFFRSTQKEYLTRCDTFSLLRYLHTANFDPVKNPRQ